MLCVTNAYALPDVDLDFFFKSATLELIEVLPAKEKTLLRTGKFFSKAKVIKGKRFLPTPF